MPPTPPLTLILAATPSLGIGKNGSLPWPQLKKEMGYFARVTKRIVTSPPTSLPPPTSTPPSPRKINAVLMGRKTWDSIPPRFRPLKDRLNIVVTRSVDKFTEKEGLGGGGCGGDGHCVEGPLVASSIPDALARLHSFSSSGAQVQVERVFVIGGASIYAQALRMKECRQVLLTRMKSEFECDTFFEGWSEADWREVGKERLREVTGEGEGVEGVVREGDVEFEFCLFERE